MQKDFAAAIEGLAGEGAHERGVGAGAGVVGVVRPAASVVLLPHALCVIMHTQMNRYR